MFRVIERERAVAFVAFRHHELAIIGPLGIGTQDRDFRADIVARFQPGLAQDVGGQRGGGGFAVGSGNEHAFARVDDGRETFGAAQQRNACHHRGGMGRVVLANGRGKHHQIRTLPPGSSAIEGRNAFGLRGGDPVRSAHPVTHS